MKVHIVCYEDVNAWILGKFARKLCENLNALSVPTDISKVPDPSADINHHIIYFDYDGKKTTVETVMVTHIDTPWKLKLLQKQLRVAKMGICASAETVNNLIQANIPKEKLCFINPAHDEVMKPRKIVVGITSKVQPSGCKREKMLVDIAKRISPGDFKFKIMGAGWEPIIDHLGRLGFEVEYYNNFNYGVYTQLVPSLDYYLYLGQDEGSMGFIDALAAGVPTIVTPQGFHKDAENGITYPFNTIPELEKVFKSLLEERNARIHAVSTWTWRHYAIKHIKVWQGLLGINVDIEKALQSEKNQHSTPLRHTFHISDSLNRIFKR